MYMQDYIKVYENVLDNCQSYIDKFESFKDYDDVEVKKGDERISFKQVTLGWTDELTVQMLKIVDEYYLRYQEDCSLDAWQLPGDIGYESVRVKRYQNNDYDRFDAHVDVNNYDTARRFLAFFVYLNTVEQGGETEFTAQYKKGTYTKYQIEAIEGRLVVFPPMFTWPHAGLKPWSNEKYLLHSYIHYV